MNLVLRQFTSVIVAAVMVGCVADVSAEEELGLSGEALQSYCGNIGTIYEYRHNGRQFYWTVQRNNTGSMLYTNESGTYREQGSINRWSTCPAATEWVNIVRSSDGQSWSCRHVCLPDGREELHCPHVQLVLTPRRTLNACVYRESVEMVAEVASSRTRSPMCDGAVSCFDKCFWCVLERYIGERIDRLCRTGSDGRLICAPDLDVILATTSAALTCGSLPSCGSNWFDSWLDERDGDNDMGSCSMMSSIYPNWCFAY